MLAWSSANERAAHGGRCARKRKRRACSVQRAAGKRVCSTWRQVCGGKKAHGAWRQGRHQAPANAAAWLSCVNLRWGIWHKETCMRPEPAGLGLAHTPYTCGCVQAAVPRDAPQYRGMCTRPEPAGLGRMHQVSAVLRLHDQTLHHSSPAALRLHDPVRGAWPACMTRRCVAEVGMHDEVTHKPLTHNPRRAQASARAHRRAHIHAHACPPARAQHLHLSTGPHTWRPLELGPQRQRLHLRGPRHHVLLQHGRAARQGGRRLCAHVLHGVLVDVACRSSSSSSSSGSRGGVWSMQMPQVTGR